MSRPVIRRKVCCMPKSKKFGPLDVSTDEDNRTTMTIDEYETIRLIDLEGFMQQECAQQMGIARTTVQRIYNDARKKIAYALVNGTPLFIEGGTYRICAGREKSCGCGGCAKHALNMKKDVLEDSR